MLGKERVLPKQVVRWGISTLGIKTGTLVTHSRGQESYRKVLHAYMGERSGP